MEAAEGLMEFAIHILTSWRLSFTFSLSAYGLPSHRPEQET